MCVVGVGCRLLVWDTARTLMDFGDLLLLAAVKWRGKPLPFTSGALGDVGDDFNMAFVDSFGGMDTVSRSLAFEYFGGLIFNGDFSDLESLIAMVASWMQTADVVLTRAPLWPDVDTDLVPLKIPLTWYENIGNWRSTSYRMDERPAGYNSYRFILYPPMSFVLQTEAWSINAQHWRSQNLWYRMWWHSDEQEGEYRAYDERAQEIVGSVYVSFKGLRTGFTTEITGAVSQYIVGEKALDRAFPNPTRTAETDNGFVFKNWTEGKYGLAEAR